jgi:hypothetical protein
MRLGFAAALYTDTGVTLANLREAATTLEGAGRIARRVFGSAHPFVVDIERDLRNTRARLAVREVDK